MTGEIDHDVSEQGREKTLNLTHRRETSQQHPFFVVFFILAQTKLSSGERERFPVLLLLLLSAVPN